MGERAGEAGMRVPATEQGGTLISTIRRRMPYFNPALRRIAEFTVQFPNRVKSMHISDLADNCEVSQSTITRFVKEIGVRSFQDMKIAIATELSQAPVETPEDGDQARVYEDITESDDHETVIRKIHFRLTDTLNETLVQIDPAVIKAAVDAIENSQLLAFFAMGSSTLAVENGLTRFLRIGKKCLFFKDQGVQQISAVALDPTVTAIAISNSGRTQPVVRALETAHDLGARTICITSFPDSPLVKHADIAIFTPSTSVPLGRPEYHESMVSKIAQIMIVDILYSAFAVRNFSRSITKLQETNEYTKSTRFI